MIQLFISIFILIKIIKSTTDDTEIKKPYIYGQLRSYGDSFRKTTILSKVFIIDMNYSKFINLELKKLYFEIIYQLYDYSETDNVGFSIYQSKNYLIEEDIESRNYKLLKPNKRDKKEEEIKQVHKYFTIKDIKEYSALSILVSFNNEPTSFEILNNENDETPVSKTKQVLSTIGSIFLFIIIVVLICYCCNKPNSDEDNSKYKSSNYNTSTNNNEKKSQNDQKTVDVEVYRIQARYEVNTQNQQIVRVYDLGTINVKDSN